MIQRVLLQWFVCTVALTTGSFLDYPWIWQMGCYSLNESDLSHSLQNNGPGRCFLECGDNTTLIALQNQICQCRQEQNIPIDNILTGPLHLATGCKVPCSDGSKFTCGSPDGWSMYRKVNQTELSRRHVNITTPGCISVKEDTFRVENCTNEIRTLCYSVTKGECTQEMLSSTCEPDLPLQSFSVFEDEACRMFVENNRYWTGIVFLDINRCDSSPCQNNATCLDGFNNYTCHCRPGFTGKDCLTDIKDCDPNPCENEGICIDGVNEFTCSCLLGFTGQNCSTNIDDCFSTPCENGGTCTDGVNNFTCTCPHGFTDVNCSSNINDCTPNPCENGGSCTDGVNNFTCACPSGYTDATCSTSTDDCAPNPCKNGGNCTDGVNNFTCACPSGYTDATCSTNINDCAPNPCENGGSCTDGVNNFTCACPPGYTDATCSTNIDDCTVRVCANGGRCVVGINNYTCECLDGYSGPNCTVKADNKTLTTSVPTDTRTTSVPTDTHALQTSARTEQSKGESNEQRLMITIVSSASGFVALVFLVVLVYVIRRFTSTTSALKTTLPNQINSLEERRLSTDQTSLQTALTCGGASSGHAPLQDFNTVDENYLNEEGNVNSNLHETTMNNRASNGHIPDNFRSLRQSFSGNRQRGHDDTKM